jgi:acyl-CoA dehydrogenase
MLLTWHRPWGRVNRAEARYHGLEVTLGVNTIYPLAFGTAAKSPGAAVYLQDPAVGILNSFFERKGLAALKQEDREECWYQDWLDYQARHQLYAAVLSPRKYSTLGHHFNLLRFVRFLEVFGYQSPAHGYSLHVSFLGLFPILMSSNEPLKREAIATLERGGLLAFAVSEEAHGSDLLANEFAVTSIAPDRFVANGSKFYIGNANAASIVSVLAKKEGAGRHGKRAPLVFFALRPASSAAFGNVRKIRTLGIRSAFVGGFDVKGHEFPATDMICEGRDAWDAVFGTVAVGRFFLGFGSIGICERALEETLQHTGHRTLFGQPVTAMPHIQTALAHAWARLTAMKLYAYRALDYVQASNPDDRRYLLFTAVQKARVSSEGVKVIDLLAECMGARGFDADTYFEMARRDIQLIPSLEGSTHINYGLTTQFIRNYFLVRAPAMPEVPSLILAEAAPDENPFLTEAMTKNSKDITFPPFLHAYAPLLAIPNVRLFARQVRAFRRLSQAVLARPGARDDAATNIAVGKAFAIVIHGQLIAENAVLCGVPPQIIAVIFSQLIEDLSLAAARLTASENRDRLEQILLRRLMILPETPVSDLQFVYACLAGDGSKQ